jgi:hypothetical protein
MIKALTPYIITTSFVSPRSGLTCTAYQLSIFVWNGAKTNAPTTPSYLITKDNPTGSTSTDEVNIGRIINDFINQRPQKGIGQEFLDGNNQKWCKTSITYTTASGLDATVPQDVALDLLVRGYGYGMDGANPDTPTNKIMATSGIEYKVNRGGFFSLPIELDTVSSTLDAIDDAIGIMHIDTQLDILANDLLGLQPTTIILVEDSFAADYGTIAINGNFVDFTAGSTFTATPQTFTYTIQDAVGFTDTATVTLTASAAPVVLTAVDDLYEANNTDVVDLYLMANDIDGGNPPIDITAVVQTGLTCGTIAIDGTGDYVTFTPNGVVPVGDETFTYTITDNIAGTDTGTVTLRVTAKGRYLEYVLMIPSSGEPDPTAVLTGNYSDTGEAFTFNVDSYDNLNINRCVIESSVSSTNEPRTFYKWDDTITC